MEELTTSAREALAGVDRLLGLLTALDGATDLHLKAGSRPKARVKGAIEVLKDGDVLSKGELDVMCRALEARCRGAVAGRSDAIFTYSLPGIGRFRVTMYRQRDSQAVVFHRLATVAVGLGELHLPQAIGDLLGSESGLIVVAAPPRNGRTSTLAAMIDHLNATRALHIVSVERVVEILHRDQLASVCQRELERDVASLAEAVRAAAHQDADVLVVDELNDTAAAEAVLGAVEAGLLVVAGVEASDVADALVSVLSLFRPEQGEAAALRLSAVLIGAVCQRLLPSTGGWQRVPAVEILINDRFAQLAVMSGDPAQIRACLDRPRGESQSFERALADLLQEGAIELRSALAASTNWPRLQELLKGQGWLDESPSAPPAPPAAEGFG